MATGSPKRRVTDQVWYRRMWSYSRWRENWYRDVWLLTISIVMLYTSLTAVNAADDARNAVGKVHEGRHFAVSVICAVESATAKAGFEQIINSQVPGNKHFVHNLEMLGYRAPSVRQRIKAGLLYVHAIADSVERQVGGVGVQLVHPDGSLDCKQFVRLAGAA